MGKQKHLPSVQLEENELRLGLGDCYLAELISEWPPDARVRVIRPWEDDYGIDECPREKT